MYCSQCGAQLDTADKFCTKCGTARKGFLTSHAETSRSSEKKEFNINFYLLGLILVVLLAPIVGLLFLGNKAPSNSISVAKAKTAKAITGKTIDDCDKCDEISLRIGDKSIVFPLEKGVDDSSGLRKHLIELTKQNDGKQGILTIFNENERNRVVDISLDISGSVIDKDKRDIESGSSILYSDSLFERLHKKLTGNNGLLPGDEIIVRLYGPDFVNNPCKETLAIKYLGPAWKANFVYSLRTHQALVEVVDNALISTSDHGEFRTSEMDEVESKIKTFYRKALVNPNHLCHTDTLVDHQLSKIIDDSALDDYTTRHYILINDGAFSFGNSYITKNSYGILNSYIMNQEQFVVNEKVLCRSPKDSFTIIGLDFGNDFNYRDIVEKFFKTILRPCVLNFENV